MGFDIINKLKKEKGLTNAQISALSGVTLSTLDKITSGANKNPKLDTLQAICRVLGCTLDDFDDTPRSNRKAPPELSDEAIGIARRYDKLDSRGKDAVSAILSCEEKFPAAQIPTKSIHQEDEGGKVVSLPTSKRNGHGFIEIKVYNQPAAAGLGNYLDEPDFRVEQYPPKVIPSKTDFGVIISGDSMEPKIHDGGTVFVQSAPSIEPGKIGVFVLNGQAYCKKLVVDQDNRQIRLVSLNPQYGDIIVDEDADTFRTLGRVLGQWTPGYKQDLLGW